MPQIFRLKKCNLFFVQKYTRGTPLSHTFLGVTKKVQQHHHGLNLFFQIKDLFVSPFVPLQIDKDLLLFELWCKQTSQVNTLRLKTSCYKSLFKTVHGTIKLLQGISKAHSYITFFTKSTSRNNGQTSFF